MISTSNFSKLWSQQQISPNYDLNSVCVCTNTIFFKTKTKTYYFSHLHSLEFHLFFALIVPFKNIRMVKNSTALALLPLWSLLRRKKSGGDPGISGLQRVDQQGPSSPSFKVRTMLLFKLSVRHPYWPVQVSSVDGEIIKVTYYGTEQTSTITNPGRAALLAFNEKVIKDLKLDENPKLKTALQKARADALM